MLCLNFIVNECLNLIPFDEKQLKKKKKRERELTVHNYLVLGLILYLRCLLLDRQHRFLKLYKVKQCTAQGKLERT